MVIQMSELTTCNHCNLKRIKAEAKKSGAKVFKRSNAEYGGVDIYVVPKGDTLDTTRHPKTKNPSDQWKAWMMEITDRCEC